MAEVQAQLDQKKIEFQERLFFSTNFECKQSLRIACFLICRKSRCEEIEARIAAGQKKLKNGNGSHVVYIFAISLFLIEATHCRGYGIPNFQQGA